MDTKVIEVINLSNFDLPAYGSEYAAGLDLSVHSFKKLFKGNKEIDISKLKHSIEKGYLNLRGFERVLIGTGLFISVPDGYELQIRSRSGVSLKRGLIVGNSPGTIDSDYRGEIGVIIYNSTPFLNKIEIGERIAQAVLSPVEQIIWKLVEKLPDTLRSTGGFGSTG